MAKKFKRKLCDEHRTFQQSWEEEFAFVEKQSISKRTNLQRHQDSCHKDFKVDFPPGGNIRKDRICSLIGNLRGQQTVLRFSCKDRITEASFKEAWNVARSLRSFTEGELIKSISKLQLSDSTLSRRVENISDDLFIKLIDDLQKTQLFSLAIDESTDVSETAQLMIWARFFNGDTFMEEMLALLPLTGQTRGEDICLALMDFFQGPGTEIDLGKLVSITTDGAPSMVGKERGLVALMRKEDLCCKLTGGEVKTTMGKVVKVVNYIRGHRQFRTLVEEYDTQYEDLTLHAAVGWLSRSIVLEKFVDLLLVIRAFIAQRKHADLYHVNDEKFALEAAFLVDTTKHLNSLNLKLQGNNKLLPALVNDVSAFMEKLSLYQDHGDHDFTHFPNPRSQVSQLHSVLFKPAICVQYLGELASGNIYTATILLLRHFTKFFFLILILAESQLKRARTYSQRSTKYIQNKTNTYLTHIYNLLSQESDELLAAFSDLPKDVYDDTDQDTDLHNDTKMQKVHMNTHINTLKCKTWLTTGFYFASTQ
uniref:DUF4371 domain-containing protein n=1 Tax=Amphiprion percula TaxID=161767 RepID=A0A3P8TSU5_AMPPE